MDAKELRNKDLKTVLESLGFSKDGADGNQYKSAGHRISVNGFAWYDHELSTGSGGAIDIVMHVLNVNYSQALEYLGEVSAIVVQKESANEGRVYAKPPANIQQNFVNVAFYLHEKRRIKPNVIDWLYRRGMLYADRYSNCVFMYGPGACELRGTGPVQWRASRGRFDKGFILPALCCTGVAALESAIDAISYRQLHTNNYAVSIGGNSNDAIMMGCIDIAESNDVPVIAAFDNDGGGDIATARLEALATARGVAFALDRPAQCKDWNDELRSK